MVGLDRSGGSVGATRTFARFFADEFFS